MSTLQIGGAAWSFGERLASQVLSVKCETEAVHLTREEMKFLLATAFEHGKSAVLPDARLTSDEPGWTFATQSCRR